MVAVTPVEPSCLLIVLRGMVINSHGSCVFLNRVPPSRLLRIFLEPPGA